MATFLSSKRWSSGDPGRASSSDRTHGAENRLWGQKRIQAELARLGFQVSTRTVAKYMRVCRSQGPTGTWREFLTRHASDIWACNFFCVPTVLFQALLRVATGWADLQRELAVRL